MKKKREKLKGKHTKKSFSDSTFYLNKRTQEIVKFRDQIFFLSLF